MKKLMLLSEDEVILVKAAITEYKHILLESNIAPKERQMLEPTSRRAKLINLCEVINDRIGD